MTDTLTTDPRDIRAAVIAGDVINAANLCRVCMCRASVGTLCAKCQRGNAATWPNGRVIEREGRL